MVILVYLFSNGERANSLNRSVVFFVKRLMYFLLLLNVVAKRSWFLIDDAKIGLFTLLGNVQVQRKNLFKLSVGELTSIGCVKIHFFERVTIGNRCTINDGVIIFTASHSLTDPKWPLRQLPVVIGDYAWIATNALILPGVTIGKGAVVGAGAVVREDVPDYGIVFGNPARLVEGRSRADRLCYSSVSFNAPYEAWLGKR